MFSLVLKDGRLITSLDNAIREIEARRPPGAILWVASQQPAPASSRVALAEFELCLSRFARLDRASQSELLKWLKRESPDWLEPWWSSLEQTLARSETIGEDTRERLAASEATEVLTRRENQRAPKPSTNGLIDSNDVEAWWSKQVPTQREALGIYHSPPKLVRWVWWSLTKYDWTSPDSGTILDPAAGTGEFGRGAIELAAELNVGQTQLIELVHRLVGVEITFASWIGGWIEWGLTLKRIGWSLTDATPQLHWHWADATRLAALDRDNEINGARDSWFHLGSRQDFGWVVGNPPYSSRVESSWSGIERLLRLPIDGEAGKISYFHYRGESLRERKTWLHDLYVRFFRLAQWWTQNSSTARLALVTNRGWLDHKTFRGMRESLAYDFPEIEIDEPAPDLEPWFSVATPIAISYLSRTAQASRRTPLQLNHRLVDLADSRSGVNTIDSQTDVESARIVSQQLSTPREPWWEFAWEANAERRERQRSASEIKPAELERRGDLLRSRGWSLTEIFEQLSSAIVTARDSLAIATSRAELEQRIKTLLDPNVSDQQIRKQYFAKSRSRRFAPGDTRGWKLPEIRSELQRQWRQRSDWRSHFKRCRYRALDDRWIVWDRALVDWPRFDSQATLVHGDWGLIARRQSPAQRRADQVLITNCLVIDGVLRSDNRGNESVFTLHRIDRAAVREQVRHPATWQLNLSSAWQNAWVQAMNDSSDQAFNPVDSLAYLYALLRMPSFQSYFHDELVRDYPRVLLLANRDHVQRLMVCGKRLMTLHGFPQIGSHTRESLTAALSNQVMDHGQDQDSNQSSSTEGSSAHEAVESWTLGAHRVLHRWERDRADRWNRVGESDSPLTRRHHLLSQTVRETQQIESELDAWVEGLGGWGALCCQPLLLPQR